MMLLIIGVCVLVAGMFWQPAMGWTLEDMKRDAEVREWLRRNPMPKAPRPYRVPRSVEERYDADPDEVRRRLDGVPGACPLQEGYGCLVLKERICFLDRGTGEQPQVERREGCPVYRRVIALAGK